MNKHYHLFSITIICLLLSILQGSPALTTITGLQSSIIILTNSNHSDSQLYISSLTTSFASTPKVALAITGLSGSNSNIDSSFHIAPQTITKTSFIVSWQRNTQKWFRVDLKYMATTREDLILGTAHTTFNGGSNKIKFDVDEIANFNASILRTFLLGCDSEGSSVKCGLLPAGVAQNSFSVEVQNMAMNAKISFSYVIFAPSMAKFTSYGGLVNKEAFKGTLNAKVFKTIAYTDHKFHGLSYLKLTGELASNFSSKIDSDFAFNLNSEQLINTLSIFYVIIGRTAKNSCTDPDYPLQLKTECLSACPDSTYLYAFSDGGKSCESCSQVFNLTLADGKCVLINKNVEITSSSKISESVNNLIPLFKTAENKQIKTISSSSIVQETSSQQQQIVQQAVAPQATSNQQQTTQQTYTNSVQPIATSSLSSSSSSSSTVSQNTPVITPTISIQQPQYQQSYTQTSNNNGIYVSQSSSTSSPVLINPQIIPNPSCGSYQFFLNGVCVCQVGYQRVGGICISLSSQSAQTVIQTKITDKSSSINPPTSNIIAAPTTVFCGQGYDNGFGVCVCSNGMRYDQGRCLPIQQQQLQYEPQHEIVKEEPSIKCGRNEKFDKEKYSCLCKRGYGRLNGVCVLCPEKMVINQNGFCVEDYREKKQENTTQQNLQNKDIKKDNTTAQDQPAIQSNSSISLQNKQIQCENITANVTIPTQTQPQTSKQQKSIPSQPKPDQNKNPSTLTKNLNSPIKPSCDDPKTPANLKLSGSMKGNNNQLFMTLDSITPFDFPDQQTMSSFLKAKFTGCSAPTLFCNQQIKNKNLFDCLLLFPSGVPNQAFTAEYSYNYQNKEGYAKIQVDPLKIQSSNLRSNSRVSNTARVS